MQSSGNSESHQTNQNDNKHVNSEQYQTQMNIFYVALYKWILSIILFVENMVCNNGMVLINTIKNKLMIMTHQFNVNVILD